MALSQLGAVFLAAGRSSRMGGVNKLLTPFRGKPLIEHGVATLTSLGLAKIIAVTGRDADEIETRLRHWDVTIERNAHFHDGMASSIAAGIAKLPEGLEGAFILPADMPFVAKEDFVALAAVFAPREEKNICVPVHQGQRGHPVLFGRRHFEALMALSGDKGAASIIAKHPTHVAAVEIASPRILIDFDRPEDFATSRL